MAWRSRTAWGAWQWTVRKALKSCSPTSACAAAFLFDGHAQGGNGGTGQGFDWSQLPTGLGKPFVLAGGLDPNNVFDAVCQTLPWGVDVASGIESAPGIKDGDKMRRFVEEVRRADCHPD